MAGVYSLVAVRGLLVAGASLVVEHGLQGTQASGAAGLSVAPWHVGSSQTRDRTHVSCNGRRVLYH